MCLTDVVLLLLVFSLKLTILFWGQNYSWLLNESLSAFHHNLELFHFHSNHFRSVNIIEYSGVWRGGGILLWLWFIDQLVCGEFKPVGPAVQLISHGEADSIADPCRNPLCCPNAWEALKTRLRRKDIVWCFQNAPKPAGSQAFGKHCTMCFASPVLSTSKASAIGLTKPLVLQFPSTQQPGGCVKHFGNQCVKQLASPQ